MKDQVTLAAARRDAMRRFAALLADPLLPGLAAAQEDKTDPVLLDFTIAPVVFDAALGPVTVDYCV